MRNYLTFPVVFALMLGVVSAARSAETSPPNDMVFTPVAPCRAFGGQPVVPSQIRDFAIAGAVDMTGQGGAAAGCGVPASAKAVSLNLSAGASSLAGYLTAYAAGGRRPNMASLSYKTNAATTGVIVQLGDGGGISVFASSPTRVGGAVTGYFEPQLWGSFAANGTLVASTGRVTSAVRADTGYYRIVFDRSVAACAATASSGATSPKIVGVSTLGDAVYVSIVDPTGKYTDYPFSLTVKC